jgi:hypothetical protein
LRKAATSQYIALRNSDVLNNCYPLAAGVTLFLENLVDMMIVEPMTVMLGSHIIEKTGINTLGTKDIFLHPLLNVVDMIVLMIVMEEKLLRWNTEENIVVHMTDHMREREIDPMIEIILIGNMRGLVEIIMIVIIMHLKEKVMNETVMIEDLYLLPKLPYILVEVDLTLHHQHHVGQVMKGE